MEENTNTDIQRSKRPKYSKPTTVRVHPLTRTFMLSMDDMPLAHLVRNAPNWYRRATEAEGEAAVYKRKYEERLAEVRRLTDENIELMRFKSRTTERIKEKGTIASLLGAKNDRQHN